MTDEPDYILDVAGLNTAPPEGEAASAAGDRKRRWLGIQFECCGVYSRIYRNRQGTAYVGYCPRCSRPVRVRIGPGGEHGRFFRAS